ncbi:hypothetical protein [Pseudorhodoplanes sinuspersici]|nr:hypothetical protein [Pseudorhodoplanes sinuspersici]
MEKFFGKATTITSAMIRDEIARAESEVKALGIKLGGALAGVAAMSDSEHVKAEGEIAVIERAITRLEARIEHLKAELPAVIVAEEATAKTATDEALRQRAEAARRANTVEAKKLLARYDDLGSQMGDVFQRLKEIADEANAINLALRDNPVSAPVTSYHVLYRKAADRYASEQREARPCWVYPDGTMEPATLDANGKVKPVEPKWLHHEQKFVTAQLESREVIIARTSPRPGQYELPLPEILAPGFAGGAAHWPRKR